MHRALAFAIALHAISSTAAADDRVYWRTEAALRNDVFTELVPPIDDQGFTHDNVLAITRFDGDLGIGGGIVDRFVTSRIDLRRWDQVDITAHVERRWHVPPLDRLTTSWRLGPTLGGNFGGRYIQNGWHSFSGTGPTVDSGQLANDYPGHRRVGLLAGARSRAQLGADTLHGFGVLDLQAGLGAGVTSGELALGGSGESHHVGAHIEVAVTRYHVADANLRLPGAYGTGWQLEWRVGVHVAWSRYRISYEYRANESGSGEPIGVIAFAVNPETQTAHR